MLPANTPTSLPSGGFQGIFVSHSHQDNQFCFGFVERLRKELRVPHQDDVFFDETSIRAGDVWLQRLQREVMKRPIFIVILSPQSVAAPYVRAETNLALDLAIKQPSRRIIPVLLEDCDVAALAPLLTGYQMVDFAHKPETAFDQLVQILQSGQELSLPSYPVPPSSRVPLSSPEQPSPRKATALRSRLLAIAAVVALLVLVLGLFRLAGWGPFFAGAAGRPTPISSRTVAATAIPTEIGQTIYQQYMEHGQQVVNDPLTGPSQYPWTVGTFSNGAVCSFRGGAFHAQRTAMSYFTQCLIQKRNYADFLFQAEMQIIRGDEGGLVFHANGITNIEYHFDVTADGHFDLVRQSEQGPTQLIPPTRNNVIRQGASAFNTIAVLTQGNLIYLYVNQLEVGNWQESASTGELGVLAYDKTQPTEVAFLNAQVWLAPVS